MGTHPSSRQWRPPLGGAKMTAPHIRFEAVGVKKKKKILALRSPIKEVKKEKIYQNLTAKPPSRLPKSWGGQKCPKNVLSLPAPRFRFAPRFQDEIVSLKKRLFYMGF